MRVLAPGAEVYFVIENDCHLMTQARIDCVLPAVIAERTSSATASAFFREMSLPARSQSFVQLRFTA